MIYLLQGVPGSGKSTWAMEKAREFDTVICSADTYFETPEGYQFDKARLGQAHAWCMRRFLDTLVLDSLVEDPRDVIVDNTNITAIEMAPYYLAARAYARTVSIIRFEIDPKIAHKRCVHGVPLATIQRMHESMQDPPCHWQAPVTKIDVEWETQAVFQVLRGNE